MEEFFQPFSINPTSGWVDKCTSMCTQVLAWNLPYSVRVPQETCSEKLVPRNLFQETCFQEICPPGNLFKETYFNKIVLRNLYQETWSKKNLLKETDSKKLIPRNLFRWLVPRNVFREASWQTDLRVSLVVRLLSAIA